jgi:superfamily II DNA or RNA helicase
MNFRAPSERVEGFPPPRQFQIDAHEALRKGFAEGHKKQLIMAPTGAGKTYIGLRICNEAIQKGKRAVFLCDRTTLIDQTSKVADRYGLSNHGVIQADHWRRRLYEPLQIASVQTVARRDYWPDLDVLVIDECHTMHKTWVGYAERSNAAIIGLSATPFSKGLGKTFTNLVNASTMHQLTEDGVLVPMRVFSCSKPDMRGAETRGGEWTEKAAEERELTIVGDVVRDWLKFGENRKTIVFGSTINHCKELCRQFNNHGVLAAVFTSETGDEERAALLNEYRKADSDLRVLISVEALAKGFDVPDVGCICDARPLRKSLSTAIQMWGRGLRSSPETSKQDCLLLDFSGNIIRFLQDYTDIFFNGLSKLDDGEKLDKQVRDTEDMTMKACPKCGYEPFHKRCMRCGWEKSEKALVSAMPGEMNEIFISVGKKKTKLADSKEHLWKQLCSYAQMHSKPETRGGRAYHLFVGMMNEKPNMRFYSGEPIPITQAVLNRIKLYNIRFNKARHKGAA